LLEDEDNDVEEGGLDWDNLEVLAGGGRQEEYAERALLATQLFI
jgi:hypothetical protein